MAKGDKARLAPNRQIIFTIQDENGQGIPDAMVAVSNEKYTAAQNVVRDGLVWFKNVPDAVRYFNLTVSAKGYKDYTERMLIPSGEYYVPVIKLQKSRIILPRLQVRGQFFEQDNGSYFTAIECSDFNLLNRFLSGEDIRPIILDRAGFNLHRVWTRMELAKYGIGDCTLAQHPDLYDRIPEFLDLMASYGRYVEFTAYMGWEDYDEQHWNKLGDACRNNTNVILELANENDQPANTIDTRRFQPIPGILCSHGSNGSQAIPVEPFWDYATFHTNGASEWQRKVGHNAMELSSKPVLSNENTRCPDRYNSTSLSFDAACAAALLCAGSCFHSVSGKASFLFDADEKKNALAWIDGASIVPLRYQNGRYNHAINLELTNILRAYQRILPDGDDFTVYIRNE